MNNNLNPKEREQEMTAIPKQKAYRDRYLLDMARRRTCLLNIPHECNRNPDTTVACHANWVENGKGMGMKAPDFFIVWGCSDCHAWLDQGHEATKEERQAVWWEAYRKQLKMWTAIAKDESCTPREKKSAGNAIEAFSDWVAQNAWKFEAGDWQLEYVKEVVCV